MDKKTLTKRVKDTLPKTPGLDKIVPSEALVSLRSTGIAGVQALITQAQELQVCDDSSYITADTLRARIKAKIKTNEVGIDTILKPINEARKVVLDIKHQLNDKLEEVEVRITNQMKTFKLEEIRALRQQEEARLQEAERLRQEAEAKARAAEKARTQPLRDKLTAQQTELEQQATEVESQVEQPLIVAGSTVRTRQTVIIISARKLMEGVIAGVVPEDVFSTVMPAINRYFKDSPEEVAEWPGIEVREDVSIVGRS